MASKQYETPEEITIRRTGQTPLTFKCVAWWDGTTFANNSTRWTEVTIFKTVGGKYIARVKKRTQWQGETNFTEAKVCSTPQEVIDYLRDDQGALGRASQEALESASGWGIQDIADPAFQAAFVEVVE